MSVSLVPAVQTLLMPQFPQESWNKVVVSFILNFSLNKQKFKLFKENPWLLHSPFRAKIAVAEFQIEFYKADVFHLLLQAVVHWLPDNINHEMLFNI